jgi:aspartyl-tRNA synthetase
MCTTETYSKLSSAPLEVLGDHYDLVVNGMEIGGGSRRVHDPALQRYIFSRILRIPDPDALFGHLLDAFQNGTPPHAGFAIGFDRLCSILVGSESIRDVIAFPKTMMGADLVVGSPSSVSDEVLSEYFVKTLGEKKR